MPNRSWARLGLIVGLVVLIVAGFAVADLLLAPKSSIAVSGRTRGNPDAKVTLVEFSDFQ